MFIVVAAIAIEGMSELLSSLDELEEVRVWMARRLGRFARISWCKFCQTFWLSMIASAAFVVYWMILPARDIFLSDVLLWGLTWVGTWMATFRLSTVMDDAFGWIEAKRSETDADDQD